VPKDTNYNIPSKKEAIRIMFNKESCKACGTYLTPISVCSVCKEYVSWLCGKCERMEDVTHSHDYYKDAAYIK
jgi:hypothetical protein